MKICILLQRRFAFVGHSLACILKEKYGVDSFCGYVYWRPALEFLQAQKDISYTSLLLDEDVHAHYKQEKLDLTYLKQLEKELGVPNLWAYIALDRVLMFNQLIREYPYNTPHYSHEEMLRIFQVKARAIITFMDKERPDAMLLPNIGGIGAMLLYQLAKKRGIKVLNIITTSLKNRFAISENYSTVSWADEHFKDNLARGRNDYFYQEAKKYLADFRAAPHPYDADATPERQPVERAKQLAFLAPGRFLSSLRWFGHLLYEHCATPYSRDYSYIHPWYYLLDHTKRKLRNLIGANDLYDEFDPKEDFAFYPLHYEPEVSLLLLAPFVPDQIQVIKQIARSLPVNYKLYVKEHPLMVIYRPRAYYKELKKIPNVKLINPAITSWNIIPHAKLITTITGSAGWEGMLFKKPVIVFGEQFYNVLGMVKRCHDFEQLPYMVKDQLDNFKYNEEELLQYVACTLEDSAETPLSYIWEQETDENKKQEGLIPLADVVAKKMGLTAIQK